MYSLIIRSPGCPPQKVVLVREKCTIGRSVRADIVIPDSFASRLHVSLRAADATYWLEDLKSANGTYHNGAQLVAPVRLQPGDVIRIGETDLEFVGDEALTPSAAPVKPVTYTNVAPAAPEATIGMGFVRTTDEILNRAQERRPPPDDSAATIVGRLQAASEPRRDLLALVSKVGVALLSNSELDGVLNEIMSIVFESLPAERGYLMMCEGDDGVSELKCTVARSRKEAALTGDITVSRYIADQVLSTRTAVLTADAQRDPRFAGQHSIVLGGMRSVMAVPLVLGERVHGLIYVENPYDRRFTPDDLEVLTTIASVASIKIENARLLEERLVRQRLEEEIAVAARIQASMLPRQDPRTSGFEIAGLSRPAAGVSGDYYDYIHIAENRMAVVIGDVTGHGISAGLMMALAKGGLFNQVGLSDDAASVMTAMNTLIFENGTRRNLMTFCYALIELDSGRVTLSNAGHPFPYVYRAAQRRVCGVEMSAYPLGARAVSSFPIETLTLAPGDALTFYSDGIVELANPCGDLLGYQRLEAIILEHAHRSAREACENLVESALRFAAGRLPEDDITTLVIKRG
jgi:serine phosphatase RsbU (regulator of sigma subunit)